MTNGGILIYFIPDRMDTFGCLFSLVCFSYPNITDLDIFPYVQCKMMNSARNYLLEYKYTIIYYIYLISGNFTATTWKAQADLIFPTVELKPMKWDLLWIYLDSNNVQVAIDDLGITVQVSTPLSKPGFRRWQSSHFALFSQTIW